MAGCVILALFFLHPGLPGALLILFASGLCGGYQIAANAAFVSATPREQRSQAFGLAVGGMSLGQGTVMILAGAAADHYSPAWVIAVCGAVGAVVALAIAISWARERRRPPGGHLEHLGVSPSGCRAWRAPCSWCGSADAGWRSSAPVGVAHGVLLVRGAAVRMGVGGVQPQWVSRMAAILSLSGCVNSLSNLGKRPAESRGSTVGSHAHSLPRVPCTNAGALRVPIVARNRVVGVLCG